MKKIAVFVSGGGSNMQAIIDSTKNSILKNLAEVVLVISNNQNAFALERAKKENIKSLFIKNDDDKILQELNNSKIDLICLAGYLSLIGENIVNTYKEKILNIHPALLPKFGGRGMFGHFVHEAVIKAKEKKSGATVHYVDLNYDTGKIILQEEVPVLEIDTAESLAKKVLVVEHKIYSKALKSVIENENLEA
jgi:phosphoribosylglycinamide formyltransferase-1